MIRNYFGSLILIIIITQTLMYGQGVAVNTSGNPADASAMLDVSSITQGVLVPRMTTVQRTTISSPAMGLLVFDSSTNSFWFYNGALWVEITANNGWSLSGSSLSGNEKFGSTNNQPVKFYSNNSERMRLLSTGQLSVGDSVPQISSDLISVAGNSTYPWPVNAYSSNNGSAIYARTEAGNNTGYATILVDYNGSGPGTAIQATFSGTNTNSNRAGISGSLAGSNHNGGAGVYGNTYLSSGSGHAGVLGVNFGNGLGYAAGVAGIGFGGAMPVTENHYGVLGWVGNNQNYSGYFNGNHVIANGTKSASVATSKGNQLLYATESPEVWFEDIGSGQLINGLATIQLDPLYLETVVIDQSHPMHVFIQMEDESQDVYVTKGNSSFTVKERNNGNSNAQFSYRVMAKRINFQDHRFGNDPVWGPGDTRKYSQYAPPPPIDYSENIQFQSQQKNSYQPAELPAGFKSLREIQKEMEQTSERRQKPADKTAE